MKSKYPKIIMRKSIYSGLVCIHKSLLVAYFFICVLAGNRSAYLRALEEDARGFFPH